jgi:RNA polymerase sigma-70 factor, ECF subfamily
MRSSEEIIEEILILRCQIGDRDALAQLIERYQEPLLYFINCLSDDCKVAEDVFQNTWLTVLKKISSLKEPGAFSTWLYRIARNYVYKELKYKSEALPINDNIPSPDNSDDELCLVEDVSKMRACLQKLNVVYREILVLRYFEQMSYQQISQVIDCDLGTVKSRIHYAKRSLRQEMEK